MGTMCQLNGVNIYAQSYSWEGEYISAFLSFLFCVFFFPFTYGGLLPLKVLCSISLANY